MLFSGQATSRKRGRAAEFKISVQENDDEENGIRHSRVEQMRPTTRPPRYMKVDTFDEKMFPSSRAVLGNIFSYKCVPFHV